MSSLLWTAFLTGLVVSLFLTPSATAAEPLTTGTITGVIRYTGELLPVQKIMTTDGGTIEHRDLVVDAKTMGLRDVMVMLEDAPPQPKLEKVKPAFMDQKDMIFIPRVLAVQYGQAVHFDNSDLCNHSVMAVSTIKENQFNVFVIPAQPVVHVFEKQSRPVLIGCSLHAWMRAWVYVVPHPWFSLTDAQGQFTIKEVPPGTYTLWLRHADTNSQHRQRVEVQPGQTVRLNLDWKNVKK